MHARLSLRRSGAPARVEHLDPGRTWTLGRGAQADVCIPETTLSRLHLELAYRSGRGWQCTDCGSKNGTLVNGEILSDGRLLPSHCWLQPGDLLVEFQELDAAGLRRSIDQGERLTQASMDVARALDPALGCADLCQRLLQSVQDLWQAERVWLLVHRDDADPDAPLPDRYRMVAAAGPGNPGADTFAGSCSAVCQALTSGAPLVVADMDQARALAAQRSVVSGGIAALLCVPVGDAGGGAPLGLLYCDSRQPGRTFTEMELAVLSDLAQNAVTALRVAENQQALAAAAARLAAAGSSPGDDVWRHLLGSAGRS